MDSGDKYIGEQIRKYRLLNHFTQDDLAEEVKLTKQIISRIEKAERKVNYRELEKISEALDQPIEVFTTIDLKFKLIPRKHHSIDVPKFAIDFLDDFDTFLRQNKNDDLTRIIKDEIAHEMESTYHKVYGTFKFL
ncbi:MAG: helix-turn-helix transcriptional regulator [Actinobacteria bacterium]|nr:helix-turn-helix transcriptional regulator [Actinomycetota bacterium]